MGDRTEILTNSRAGAFLTCPRLHHYRYNLCRRPIKKSYALRFGSLFHSALEAWWKPARRRGCGIRNIQDVFATLELADFNEFDMVKAERLLDGYHARWFGDDVEVIAVEKQFVMPLVNPATGRRSRLFQFAGKIDAIARVDGRVVIVEHKTSSEDISPGSDYWLRLRMDSQVSAYIAGARWLGHQISACLYDVAARPLSKPLKATPEDKRKYKKDGTLYANLRDVDETVEQYAARLEKSIATQPDRYFQRGTVVRTEDELNDHGRDMWTVAKMIHRAGLEHRHTKNTRSCVRFGQTCSYLGVCSGTADLNDPELFTDSAAHPELEQAT